MYSTRISIERVMYFVFNLGMKVGREIKYIAHFVSFIKTRVIYLFKKNLPVKFRSGNLPSNTTVLQNRRQFPKWY